MFILRAMDLREKIIIASEGDDQLKVDKGLVQFMFIRALTTGLLDEYVKVRIGPSLRAGASDEVIIREVNQSMSEDVERRQKRGQLETQRNRIRINETSVGYDQILLPPREQQRENNRRTDTASVVQKAVAPLLQEFNNMTE